MKIGIIVHSKTGNTQSVAQKMKERFEQGGHTADIKKVSAHNDEQFEATLVNLNEKPDISGYDILFLGGPVRGFSMSPVMKAFLQEQNLQGVKAAVFVTHAFPFKFMGGNQAIEQFKAVCVSKGAEILETGVINWSGGNREKQIKDLVEKMSKML